MRYRAWAACTVSASEIRVRTANTICSIGAFTPNPLRADGEVDPEPADSHQGEPAQPVQVGRHAPNRADARPPAHHAAVRACSGPSSYPIWCKPPGGICSFCGVYRATMNIRILIADDHAMVRE